MSTVHDFHLTYSNGVTSEYRLVHEVTTQTLTVYARTIENLRIRKPLRWVRHYSRVKVDDAKLARAMARLVRANYSRELSARSRILETRPNAFQY